MKIHHTICCNPISIPEIFIMNIFFTIKQNLNWILSLYFYGVSLSRKVIILPNWIQEKSHIKYKYSTISGGKLFNSLILFYTCSFISGFPLTLTKKQRIMEQNVMGKNQFLFIVANKMFLMIIDKGRDTIINTNSKEKPWWMAQPSAFNDVNQLHVFPPWTRATQ